MHAHTKWIMAWADRIYARFGTPETGVDWCRVLAYASKEEGNDHPSHDAIELATKWENSRFKNVYCSQCGKDFGPGDHGFSHCQTHRDEGLVAID